MADVTYTLPDGSIKSFPETTSEQDIRRFVATRFPWLQSGIWQEGPISQHRVRFDDETLSEMARLYDVAKPYADRLGVDPYLAIGGPAEEMDTVHRMNPILRLGNTFFDWQVPIVYGEAKLREDVQKAKRVDQSHGVSYGDKLTHPTLVDLGPGNIKFGNAISLLTRYNKGTQIPILSI